MKKFFLLLLSALILQSHAHAWGLKDLGQEVASPVTNKEARKALIIGGALTLTLAIFKDQIVDHLQNDAVKHKPLGHSSKYGDLAGQLLPNGIYVLTNYFGIRDEAAKERALGMFKATAYAGAVTNILKYTVREPRPNNHAERNAFPSGHSTTIFAFASYVAAEHGWAWGAPAMALGAFSGYSRINDNRHNLIDVVAGGTIGFGYGWAIQRMSKNKKATSAFFMPIVDKNTQGLAMVKSF